MAVLWTILQWDTIPVVITLLTVYVAHYYYRYLTRRNPLPGPLPIPLLGNMHQIARSDFAKFLVEQEPKYGELYEIYLGNQRTICIATTRFTDKFMNASTNSVFFSRGHTKHLAELDVLDKGTIFNDDMDSWRYNRKALIRATTSPEFLDDFCKRMGRSFDEMASYWFNLSNADTAEFDLMPWMIRFTTEAIVTSITGRHAYVVAAYYNSLAPPESHVEIEQTVFEDTDRIVRLLEVWSACQSFFLMTPPWMRKYIPPLCWYQNRYLNKLRELNNELLECTRARKREVVTVPKGSALPSDLLTLLMTANTEHDSNPDSEDSEARPLTDAELQTLLREIFSAGSETTAHSFVCTVYCLCKNKHVIKRLREELDQVLGSGNARRHVTHDDLKNLPYCEAVIKEVLRVISVSSLLLRYANAEIEVAGYTWPAGQDFCLNVEALHKDAANWDEPERFNPDRWLAGGVVERNAFFAFGGGIRICPGRYMASVQLRTLLAQLISNYDVELVDENAPLTRHFTLLNACDSLPVKISRRT